MRLTVLAVLEGYKVNFRLLKNNDSLSTVKMLLYL